MLLMFHVMFHVMFNVYCNLKWFDLLKALISIIMIRWKFIPLLGKKWKKMKWRTDSNSTYIESPSYDSFSFFFFHWLEKNQSKLAINHIPPPAWRIRIESKGLSEIEFNWGFLEVEILRCEFLILEFNIYLFFHFKLSIRIELKFLEVEFGGGSPPLGCYLFMLRLSQAIAMGIVE